MSTHQKKHTQHSGNRALIIKDKNQDYATITLARGNCRFDCTLLNGSVVIAKLVGRLITGPAHKRINIGDFVLIEKYVDNTESDVYHIIHKYEGDHKTKLMKQGELKINKVSLDEGNISNILMEGETYNPNYEVDMNKLIDDI